MIGVSAIRRNGSVPAYSNRDAVYNDLTAPGDAMFSTVPRNLVEKGESCVDHPYSDCGPFEFRNAIGTSFAAPQVSAAAALLLGQRPSLRPEQVSWLLERSASDASALTGCSMCPTGRDLYTGWGSLDVLAALTMLTDGTSCPLPTGSSRTTTPARGRTRCRRCRGRSTRRSTTGTTTSTSTGCI